MLRETTKKGDVVYAILGESVRACEYLHSSGVKFCSLNPLGIPDKEKIYKQKSFCFNTEREALEVLREKLEDALSRIEYKINLA